MLKSIVSLIKYLFSLLFILLFIFIAVNWGDEELKPEVTAILNWQPPANIFDDNGYILLLGMDASAAQDAHQVGKKKFESELARYKMIQSTHQEVPAKVADETQKIADWSELRCDYRTSTNCVDFYLSQNKRQLAEVFAEHKIQLARFDSIKHSELYLEALIPDVSAEIPKYSAVTSASELLRIQAILAITDKQTKQGVMQFVENAQFSRRLLKNSNSLISHMVALSMLQRDVQILSELLTRHPTLASTYQQEFEALLATIETNEFSIQKAFVHERNMMLSTINNLKYATSDELLGNSDNNMQKSAATFSQRMLFKTYQANATTNLFYDLGTLPVQLAQAPPQQLAQVQNELEQKRASYFKGCISDSMLCIKNPIGKILAGIAGPDYLNYIERHHDMEGYIRLVRLQLHLLAEEIPKAQITQVSSSYLNPYTQQAMEYDSEKNTLTFEGHTKQQGLNTNFVYQVNLP